MFTSATFTLWYMNKKYINLKEYLCSQSIVQKWGNYLHNQIKKYAFDSNNYFKSPTLL